MDPIKILMKYDDIRILDLSSCESYRRFYVRNAGALDDAVDACNQEQLNDALHLLADDMIALDCVARVMSVIQPPDWWAGDDAPA